MRDRLTKWQRTAVQHPAGRADGIVHDRHRSLRVEAEGILVRILTVNK